MEPQVLVSLASAAVAILVSSITTLLSLRTQRENTRTTLDVQERLPVAQEQALRERSRAQDLRDKRVHPHISLIKWAERLLAALTEMNEDSNPYLSLQDWTCAATYAVSSTPDPPAHALPARCAAHSTATDRSVAHPGRRQQTPAILGSRHHDAVLAAGW
jgi:hypothetical protein